MATLQELMAQREALERQIEQTKKQERGEAIEKVRALMAEYGLTVADLGSRSAGAKAEENQVERQKVAAKYRNASTGESWSGRGLQPRWLKAALASGTQARATSRCRSSRPAPSAPRRLAPAVKMARSERAVAAPTAFSADPARLRPRAAVPGRHRRDRRSLGRAEARRLDLEGPVPLPRREVAELHRHALAPDLPLLRLRRPRQRGRLPDGAARHGLHRGRARPRPAGRPVGPRRHAASPASAKRRRARSRSS